MYTVVFYLMTWLPDFLKALNQPKGTFFFVLLLLVLPLISSNLMNHVATEIIKILIRCWLHTNKLGLLPYLIVVLSHDLWFKESACQDFYCFGGQFYSAPNGQILTPYLPVVFFFLKRTNFVSYWFRFSADAWECVACRFDWRLMSNYWWSCRKSHHRSSLSRHPASLQDNFILN